MAKRTEIPAARDTRRGDPTAAQEAVDVGLFRDAMSRLGAAVNIVSTDGPAGKAGFTATAVCSVSDDPPTLLVCLNRRSQITPVLMRNGIMCVNALGADQAALADVFAGRTGRFMEERFEIGPWTVLESGSPVLESAIVALDCAIVDVQAIATHNVFFGVIKAIRHRTEGRALIYHDRAYKQV